MAWDFDHEVVINKLITVLDEMVGERLSFLKNADGTPTAMRSIIPDNQNAQQPDLPFITLSYEGSNDNAGYLLGSGTIEVENPDDPPNMVWAPYWDKFVQFGITIRCEGEEAQSILRSISKKLLIPRYRDKLNGLDGSLPNVYTSVELISPILRTPDLLDTEYREVGSMLLKLNTVDREIDIETGVFDTINYEATYKRGTDDPDPIIHQGSVTSNV